MLPGVEDLLWELRHGPPCEAVGCLPRLQVFLLPDDLLLQLPLPSLSATATAFKIGAKDPNSAVCFDTNPMRRPSRAAVPHLLDLFAGEAAPHVRLDFNGSRVLVSVLTAADTPVVLHGNLQSSRSIRTPR